MILERVKIGAILLLRRVDFLAVRGKSGVLFCLLFCFYAVNIINY